MRFLRFSCCAADIFNIGYSTAENAEKENIKFEWDSTGPCLSLIFLNKSAKTKKH